MKTLHIDLSDRSYDIHIAPGLLKEAGARIRAVCPKAGKLFVVTDSNVAPLYLKEVEDSLAAGGFQTAHAVVAAGEPSKNVRALSMLWERMASLGLTRTDAVVALGGGVVGDLAGFAASTILRGVDFIQLPTTLLAQVDSSVGGKVAIDLEGGKNLAGAFHQPKLVLMDTNTLNTLSDDTFADGMAEVIKYGCIKDKAFFSFLHARPTRTQLMEDMEEILHTCCNIKRSVVEADEFDTGERMLLNFGHTFGHAYELAGNYRLWTHGQAVAAGMVLAARLGASLGVTPPEVPIQIRGLVATHGLPSVISCKQRDYAAAIGRDKKGAGEDITIILLEQLGRAVPYSISKEALLDRLEGMA